MNDSTPRVHKASLGALTLGALGVVFGDIGTSPLYAMKETFGEHYDLAVDTGNVYGVISLIFWSITIVVSVKYVALIMKADNEGEGGIMALISRVQGLTIGGARAKWLLIALGVFGAALFYGDGMITPAISVLSAVEGLHVAEPGLEDYVVPITVAIITGLFCIQRFGTDLVGKLFGPITALWFITLGVLGLGQIVEHPGILQALSPHHAAAFFISNGGTAFLALGSVVLAVTGAEALYADMGHFGRPAIRRAWFFVVLPALVLNYMGQGALLLENPEERESPFFHLAPDALLLPLVILATLATVIASQAVISGAFSVTRQAVQLGFLPLVTIRHTSKHEIGQIYVPAVNWGLFVAIVALVIGFGSSSALASAYGIAVTGTLAIDTILFFVVVHLLWKRPLWLAVTGAVLFLIVDLAFFAANVPKIIHGGWVPLAIGLVVFAILTTWRRGRDIVLSRRTEQEGALLDFVLALQKTDEPPVRVRGTAIFLTPDPRTTPLALRYNVEHNRVLHEQVVVVAVKTANVPYVREEERVEIDDLLIPDDGISLVTITYGFQEDPDVPAALRLCKRSGLKIDVDAATFFLSRVTLAATDVPGMAPWRERLFVALNRNSASRARYFCLPEGRVVFFGSEIKI